MVTQMDIFTQSDIVKNLNYNFLTFIRNPFENLDFIW